MYTEVSPGTAPLWLPLHYGDGQIRSIRGRGRKDRRKTGNVGKIPWDKES